jgi:hypothetical protein
MQNGTAAITNPAATSSGNQGAPPVAFVVAVWLGMPREEILRGLGEGWIAAPPGSPPGWTPAAWSAPGPVDGGAAADAAGSLITSDPQDHEGAPMREGRARVQSWLHALDPSLTDTAFASLWQSAGADDEARGAAWTSRLAGMLLGTAAGDGNTGATAVQAIDRAVLDPANRTTLLDLASMRGAQLAGLAREDVGVRHALASLDDVAFTDNRGLAGLADPDGALDRFDADTGDTQRSDAWIDDRARFFAWRQHAASGGTTTIPGEDAWSFVDHARRDAEGQPSRLDLAAAGGANRNHRVVFGSADADVIAGGDASDRLHGDAGADRIRGGAGNDLIEGGRGDDALAGDGGDDELDGGRGDDDLDGGAGADRLDGGTGGDTLTGGSGNDLLAGGRGDDTYVVDSADGIDTIVDADGLGRVVVDGRVLSVAPGAENGTWRSADGAVTFRFSGDARQGGELAITVGAGETSGGTGQTIRVRGFRNGDLGLTFGDGSPAALAAGAADGTTDVVTGGTSSDGVTDATFRARSDASWSPDDVAAAIDGEPAGSDLAGNAAPGGPATESAAPVATSDSLLAPWPDVVGAMGPLPDLATIVGAGFAEASIAAPPDIDVVAAAMPAPGVDAFAGEAATGAWFDGGPGSTEIAAADASGAADGEADGLSPPSAAPQAESWASWWTHGSAPLPQPPGQPSFRGTH